MENISCQMPSTQEKTGRGCNKAQIFISSILMATASCGVNLAVSLFAMKRLSATPFEVGLNATLYQGVITATSTLFGKLSDKIGYQKLLIASGILYFLVGIFFCRAQSMNQVYFQMCLLGIAIGAFWPSMEHSTGEDSDGGNLIHRLGVYNISWGLGAALGPQLAGILFGKLHTVSFDILAVMAFLSGLIILVPLGSKNSEKTETASIPEKESKSPDPTYLYCLWIANFGVFFCAGMVRNVLPTLGKGLGFSSMQIGFLVFSWGAAMTLLFAVWTFWNRWPYRSLPILIAQAVTALGLFLIYRYSTLPQIALGVCLSGAGAGITFFSGLFYAMDGYADKGTKCGIHETVVGIGTLTGAFLAGKIAQQFRLNTPYILGTCVVILTLIVTAFVLHRATRRPGIEISQAE